MCTEKNKAAVVKCCFSAPVVSKKLPTLFFLCSEKFHQRGFPAPVPSGAAGEAAQAGLHHQDSTLDLRPIIQGTVHEF
jgi:hypothetical protein